VKTITGQLNIAMIRGMAIHFIYVTPNKVSTRLVWPFRFRTIRKFIGMDFGRGEMREFKTDQIWKFQVIPAWQVFPPYQMKEKHV